MTKKIAVLPKGKIVKLNGVPLELLESVRVYGDYDTAELLGTITDNDTKQSIEASDDYQGPNN